MVQIVLLHPNLNLGILILFLCPFQRPVQLFQLLGQGLDFRPGQIAFQLLQGGLCLALLGLLAADPVGAGQHVLVQSIQLPFQIQHPALPQFQLFLPLRNGPVLFPVFLAQILHLPISPSILLIGKSLGQRQDLGAQICKLFLLPPNLLRAVVQGPFPAFHLAPLLGGQVQRHRQIGSGGAYFIGLLKLLLCRFDLLQTGLGFFQFLLLFFDLPGKGRQLPFPVGPPGRSADIPGRLPGHAPPLQHPLAVPAVGGKPGIALRLFRKAGQQPRHIRPCRQFLFRPQGQRRCRRGQVLRTKKMIGMFGQQFRHLFPCFRRHHQSVENPCIRQLRLQQGTALRRQVRRKIHQFIKGGMGYAALLQVGAGGLHRFAALGRQIFLVFQFPAADSQLVELLLTVLLLLFPEGMFLHQRHRKPLQRPVQNLLHFLFLGQSFVGGDLGKKRRHFLMPQAKGLRRFFQHCKGFAQFIPHGAHRPSGLFPLGLRMAQGLGGIILILLVPVQLLQGFLLAAQQFRRFAQPDGEAGDLRLFLPEINRLQVGRVPGVTQLLILLSKLPKVPLQQFLLVGTATLRLKALSFFRVQRILFSLFFLLFPLNSFLLLLHLAAAFFLALHGLLQIATGIQFIQLTGKLPHLLFRLLVACPGLLQCLLRQGDLIFQALYFGLPLLGKLTGRQIVLSFFAQHILVVAGVLVAQLAGLL